MLALRVQVPQVELIKEHGMWKDKEEEPEEEVTAEEKEAVLV